MTEITIKNKHAATHSNLVANELYRYLVRETENGQHNLSLDILDGRIHLWVYKNGKALDASEIVEHWLTYAGYAITARIRVEGCGPRGAETALSASSVEYDKVTITSYGSTVSLEFSKLDTDVEVSVRLTFIEDETAEKHTLKVTRIP